MSSALNARAALADRLAAFSLSLPEAWEDYPWEDRVVKVRKKIFIFLGHGVNDDGAFSFTVKLPDSAGLVLEEPWATPCGYGLGRHSWVSFSWKLEEELPPEEQLLDWIRESYRAVAPKTLARQIG